ncbi:MAG: hypothetical protein L0Z50_42095 [Verrucomicrobiales bacterium]|nr:hypothetical protein [Verrucomicrobiales bacterium]
MLSSQLLTSFEDRGCWLFVTSIVCLCSSSANVTADAFAIFDTNRVMTIELKLGPADWKTLRYQHRGAEFFPEERALPPTNAYSWFAAEAFVNGSNVGHIEMRKKG